MLNGIELGNAIKQAIKLKLERGSARSRAEIARAFGVRPPSLYDWEAKGSISKGKLEQLWIYFSDVVGPEHWGLNAFPSNTDANEEGLVSGYSLSPVQLKAISLIDQMSESHREDWLAIGEMFASSDKSANRSDRSVKSGRVDTYAGVMGAVGSHYQQGNRPGKAKQGKESS